MSETPERHRRHRDFDDDDDDIRDMVAEGLLAEGLRPVDPRDVNPRREFLKLSRRVCLIERDDASEATGFLVAPDLILTTAHALMGTSGIFADPDQPRATCRANAGAPLPEPRCTPERLWAIARERGAPAAGNATLEYFRAHDGPAWRFSLPEAKLNFTMFGDCERELKGKDARPIAP